MEKIKGLIKKSRLLRVVALFSRGSAEKSMRLSDETYLF